MVLDAQAAEFLAKAGSRPPRRAMSVEQSRAGALAMIPYGGEVVPVASVRDLYVPGPGGPVPVREYHPYERRDPAPALLWFHGGGWVVGDLETADRACRRLAALAECAVVSVDYRRAPEHPFPAAVDDAVAAMRALTGDPDRFGVDPRRIAVGGDSAGGNLAAVLAQIARDEGLELCHQLLVYPVVDTDTETPASYTEFAEGYSMSRDDMRYYFENYLGDHDRTDPRVAPARAASLSGLCPATVINVEHDVLRDEGEAYARALADAGVPVRARRFDGLFHPSFYFAGALDGARTAQEFAASSLHDAFQPVG